MSQKLHREEMESGRGQLNTQVKREESEAKKEGRATWVDTQPRTKQAEPHDHSR